MDNHARWRCRGCLSGVATGQVVAQAPERGVIPAGEAVQGEADPPANEVRAGVSRSEESGRVERPPCSVCGVRLRRGLRCMVCVGCGFSSHRRC